MNVAAGDTAMEDVADQSDREPLHAALVAATGENVEQSLRGVLVWAVAGVDNTRAQMFCQQMRGAGRRVPDYHHVHAHGLDILRSVDEGLALADAGAAGGEIQGCRAEPPRCQTEAVPGARGRLEK